MRILFATLPQLGLVHSLAFAQTAPSARPSGALSLRWNDPNALAATSAADFEARLSERLGRPAFDPSEARHALTVTWQGSPEQCQVELQLLQGDLVDGTRLLESPSGDCRALVPALLTVSALLIEAHGEPEAEPAPAPAPAPPRPTPVAPPEPRSEVRVLLSAGAMLSQGLAPKLELGPAASVVVKPLRHLRVGALGALFLPHQYGAAPGLSLGHDTVALLVCGMPLTGALSLGVCGSGGLHRWSARGISLVHPETQHTSAWTAGLLLRGEWQLVRQVWWVGHVGADVATEPLYFYFTPPPGGESVLYRQQRVAPSLFLGLTLEVP
ncbi:MAG TPA: hypothetical protein VHP33_11795 [Polyangiaceae bacterium]|nr:hypothetical protein [Polyangiaceae bacterium]